MRWSHAIAVVALILVTGCATHTPCPPGEDCRWVVDADAVGLWLAADPAVAAVLRIALHDGHGLSLYALWERCGAEVCTWTPPAVHGRLDRHEDGVWVVSLARAAFARDPATELVAALRDGSRLRIGVAMTAPAVRPGGDGPDLATCIRDLEATLAAAAVGATPSVHPEEIELVCRIWVHPDQGRSAMRWHPTLHAVARAHACDMAERDFFGHTDPDGVGPNLRARAAGYTLPDWYDGADDGNNIESLALRGPTSSPATTIGQWLESPLHRQHVLGETDFKAAQDDIATGYCRASGGGVDKHYWAFVSAHGAP
jgi:hypothetical protein